MRASHAAAGLVLALLALAAALVFAGAASAAPPSEGDWNVTGTESYADQAITLSWASDNSSLGNLTVAPAAVLRFDNVTLYMPVFSVFDIEGTVEVRNSTLYGAGYRILVNGSALFEDNTIMNATLGGTVVQTDSATFVRNTWDCGGSSSGTIHIRRPIDFSHNTMRQACLVDYELPVLETTETIEFSWNTFNDTGGGTQLTFENARHNGTVLVDIHNITVIGGGWSILLGATAPNTSFYIHDSTFLENGLATVRADDFEGDLRLWNLYYHNIYRAARINGVPGRPVVAHIDNITVTGNTTDSIYANEATWIIRNSTIGGTTTQFEGGTNGHIMVYDTADTPFFSTTSGSGGTVEHFAFLNIDALTWQGDVPFTAGEVKFRNATGRNFLDITPSNWTPSHIVWWGMYSGGGRVDNRDLRPTVEDGQHTFACAPFQFFVTVPMAALTITCTDDASPEVTITSPSGPAFTNGDWATLRGLLSEAGAGLASATLHLGGDYDLLGLLGAELPEVNITVSLGQDGTYGCYIAAVDRVGNEVNATCGPVERDTVVPVISVEDGDAVVNQTTFELTGSSEPNATLHVRFSAGWTRTEVLGAAGLFTLTVPVSDGQNTYLIIVTDRAGNSVEGHFVVHVDRTAPNITVLVNGQPDLAVFTSNGTAHILVACDGYGVAVGDTWLNGTGLHLLEFEVLLSEGANHIPVRCADWADNLAETSVEVFLDTTPPVLAGVLEGNEPLPDGSYVLSSNVAPLIASATDAGSGVVSLGVNGNRYEQQTDGSVAVSVGLEDGENLIHLLAVDQAGNSAVLALRVARDTAAPVLTATWEAAGPPIIDVAGVWVTAGPSANIVISLSEAATVEVAGVAHDLPAGTSSIAMALAEGQNRVAIELEDAAGNVGIGTDLAITRDTTAPEVSVDEPQPGAELGDPDLTVSGAAEPGTAVLVNGGRVFVSPTGEYHATVALAEGSNTIIVEATDAVGNTANVSLTVTYAAPAEEPRAAAGGALELPMLIAGLAVGVGAGAGIMAARRRGPAGRGRDAEPAAGPRGPQEGPAAPEEPAPPPVQKGPRGPQPP